MGYRLMQDSPPLRSPPLRLIHLFVLLVALFRMSSGIGQVFKSVNEKVSLSCGYNFSFDELAIHRIYWQKDDRKMVLSISSGDKKVWPEYQNRTLCDISNNFSLMILGLLPSDRGTYECVVQKKERGVYLLRHLNSVELSIRADFPVPNITQFGNQSADMKTIICETSGGFPEPRLSWLESGRELRGINTTVSQDPESELYAVSSKLDFNATYNRSIVCSVAYGKFEVSKNFTWKKPPEAPPDRKNTTWITTNVAVSILPAIATGIAILLIIFAVYHCRRRRNVVSRRENNSIYTGPAEVSAEQTV
ncbi:T-lymphocyte activation antigen CD80 isoform X1 [Meriones unguiculatus]|uniref:T-lymphocyte activation antigen CD80 isoform X1 n=1 Tax=Meriones unguiculatus TaxID=10047 RepID=UPI000B4F0313|nr:T-lymphocyte activation antigen CD80 isoform X1 [Meriones unguiculatus]XP_021504271.1 T-lymphocyte activation antigen CD80 isoform X1 [Meriones unguiculatus]XP_021504273.1 T-lymphocyte activation antigen CD80 isoform X1 [Meriones unguiculatus]XP_060226367.1 T-lymphocyte activation antigen CD80 isoform X1 [Meriones unguiculatus]XP_060226368.1 T-lymphocyte activation antigen CD80 isoform X1 [Meriones unguiculatus]